MYSKRGGTSTREDGGAKQIWHRPGQQTSRGAEMGSEGYQSGWAALWTDLTESSIAPTKGMKKQEAAVNDQMLMGSYSYQRNIAYRCQARRRLGE